MEPILLPTNDPLTRLIIIHYHTKLQHAGIKHIMSEIRYKFWIPKARSSIKQQLKKCLLCQKQKGGAFRQPEEPPLPMFRVTGKKAFSTVGIDYIGPLMIYPHQLSTQKVWLCLFSCALSRAIHLEVVTSMSTE